VTTRRNEILKKPAGAAQGRSPDWDHRTVTHGLRARYLNLRIRRARSGRFRSKVHPGLRLADLPAYTTQFISGQGVHLNIDARLP
jgi:hypothetical protein